MRRILFVHQNFPAQYTHLAPELAKRGHQVLALTASSNTRPSAVPTVRYRYDQQTFPLGEWRIAGHFAQQARRGERVAAAAMQMKKTGYHPEVILGHPGWGETLFLHDVWPDARHIAYAEFFYRPSGQDVGFDPEFRSASDTQALFVRARQASQLLAMETADIGVSPTHWQAKTYPEPIRKRIETIHDGIDTDLICPNPLARVRLLDGRLQLHRGEEILTFVSRNLEPYRGFHVFMRALPGVLRRRPTARVVIVGGDSQSYGGPPQRAGCWREAMLAELGDQLDLSRVHFVGKLPYADFLALMQVTRVHAYLTYPFVLSWSLLEAMSAGALVVGSRTPPVEEVITDRENGILVDFFDLAAWTDTLVDALANPEEHHHIGKRARNTVQSRYDLRRLCLPRQMEICGIIS